MVNGKAKLAREHFCDGLGDCLPACPADAIRFVEREAPAYDEAAVQAAKGIKESRRAAAPVRRPCASLPSAALRTGRRGVRPCRTGPCRSGSSEHLGPLSAGCGPCSLPRTARRFPARSSTAAILPRQASRIIGCPKLDAVDYSGKAHRSCSAGTTSAPSLVVRMQVPCCGGLTHAVETALAASGRDIPLRVVILTPSGEEVA